jgi:UDP-N-acetylmuramyl pentapeptide synthase
MTFQELISGLDIIECSQNCSIEITNIVYDSRKARNGSLFVAIDGYVTDGHKYIEQAVSQDVSAVLIQHAPDEMNPQQFGLNWYHWDKRKNDNSLYGSFNSDGSRA